MSSNVKAATRWDEYKKYDESSVLNTLGENGWELFQVIEDHEGKDWPDRHFTRYCFKRL